MHSFPNLFDQGTIFLESISVASVLQNMALGSMDVDKEAHSQRDPYESVLKLFYYLSTF